MANNTENFKMGYLLISSPVPNVFVGGLMVNDSRGLPLEFRYTEPIQPTKIQQVLYGQVLSRYIKREVIEETLLKSLDSKIQCLIVEDENLLDYPAKGFPVLRLGETKSSPIGSVGTVESVSGKEFLLQTSKEGSPLRVQLADTPPTGSTEGEASSNGAPSKEFIQLLAQVGEAMDLVEPLKRIEKALEAICQETGVNAPSAG